MTKGLMAFMTSETGNSIDSMGAKEIDILMILFLKMTD